MEIPENANLDFIGTQLERLPFLEPLMTQSYFGNTLAHYLGVVLAVFLVYALAQLVMFGIDKYAKHITSKTKNKLDDLILEIVHRSITFVLVLATVYLGVRSLTLPETIYTFTEKAVFVLFTLKIAKELDTLLEFVVESYLTPLAKKQKGLVQTFIPPVLKFIKIVVWGFAGVLIIANLGYDVTGLIAGVGIGGIALALAAQETLSNAFGSFSILADNPFNVGDWVSTEGYEGEIVEIGFRSTKIQTMDLSIVSIPNMTIAGGIIENYSRRNARKVEHTIALTYSTSVKNIKAIIKELESLFKKDKDIEDGSYRVNFKNFGDSALELEVLYYITDMKSYARYLDIRERINLKIKETAEKIGVEMAFPTQSLYIQNAKDLVKANSRRKVNK
jgi:MscS family membrane protein